MLQCQCHGRRSRFAKEQYMYMNTHIYICEKTLYQNLALALQARFRKELFIYKTAEGKLLWWLPCHSLNLMLMMAGTGRTNSSHQVGWLLGFDILATFNVISGWVPTCDSWHWPNQFLYYPINAEHLARKWQVWLVWLDQEPKSRSLDLPTTNMSGHISAVLYLKCFQLWWV